MLDQFFVAPYWQNILLGNTWQSYATVFLILLGLLVLSALFHLIVIAYVKKLAAKTETDVDDTLVEMVRTLKPPFYIFLAFWLSINVLKVHDFLQQIIDAILIIWLVGVVVKAIQILVSYVIQKKVNNGRDQATKAMIDLVNQLVKIVLWSVGLLMIFSNLGIDVTSLIAGLGIGGIAIALALKGVLSDLFSSISIYFDKPFQPGDYVVFGDVEGTIEKIGMKTTRLRALQGEEVIISNQKLTSGVIHNYHKLKSRRMELSFKISAATKKPKLEALSEIIRKKIEEIEYCTFKRASFAEFSGTSLQFEIVYYIEGGGLKDFKNIHSQINLQLKEALEKEAIDFV